MKKMLLLFTIAVLLVSCKKTILSSQLIGSWQIKKILPLNSNSDYQTLDFRNGTFIFNENQSFVFKNFSETYEGYWVLEEYQQSGNCYTNQDGNQECDYDSYQTLHLNAKQTTTQQVKKADFEFLKFYKDGTFTGKIYTLVGIPAFEYTFEKK